MDLIRCPQCAKEIPDVSRFCRRCGGALAWGAAATTSWAGLPPSAWDAGRAGDALAFDATKARRPQQKTEVVKRGGGSAWAASAMIGAAAFMVVSHVHRATVGPMAMPARVSPVRAPVPPPQLVYPRSSVNLGNRRTYAEPPVVVSPAPMPGRVREANRYEPPQGYWKSEVPERRGSGWGED